MGWAAAYAVEGLARVRRAKEAPRLSRGRMRFLYYNQHYSGEKAQRELGYRAAVHLPGRGPADAGLVPGAGPASRIGDRRLMGERIAVVGATGYTGGLVVEELVGRGTEVVAIGRNPAKLDVLPAQAERQVADISDRVALAAALDGCRAVINCVGSFLDLGEAVVDAAVAAGVPYVDTTGEFPFLRRVFDVHDAPARKAGVAVVPGMAFYSAPADLASALATRALGRPPDSVEIGYRLVGARPSKGTLRTNLRRIGQPCPVWEDGRLVSRRIGEDPKMYPLPRALRPGHRRPLARRRSPQRPPPHGRPVGGRLSRHAEGGGRRLPQPAPHRSAAAGRAGPGRAGNRRPVRRSPQPGPVRHRGAGPGRRATKPVAWSKATTSTA